MVVSTEHDAYAFPTPPSHCSSLLGKISISCLDTHPLSSPIRSEDFSPDLRAAAECARLKILTHASTVISRNSVHQLVLLEHMHHCLFWTTSYFYLFIISGEYYGTGREQTY